MVVILHEAKHKEVRRFVLHQNENDHNVHGGSEYLTKSHNEICFSCLFLSRQTILQSTAIVVNRGHVLHSCEQINFNLSH